MSTVVITHEASEGTLITGDFRPHTDLVKIEGFRWSGRNRFWYLPNSRDRRPDEAKIARVAVALEAVGFTVEITVDATNRPTTEVEADRSDRLDARQERLGAKADHLAAEAEAKFARADHLAGAMNGQPVLIGHHSEKRHRADLARMNSGAWNGMDAYKESQETARRASASEANQAHRSTAPVTIRRIEKLEAERRGHERELIPCPTSGRKMKAEFEGRTFTCPTCYHEQTITAATVPVHGCATGAYAERLTAEIASIDEQVGYWRAHLATLEATGVKLWGKADFAKGDEVRSRGRWHRVVRVNAKSVTVETGHSWTETISYDDVSGQRRPAAEAI